MKYYQKPWLKSYDTDVSPEISIPEISLKDYYIETFNKKADSPALYYMGLTMTFGELLEKAGRFAKGLQDKGFGKGDVVAICLPNIPQYHIAVVGALLAGCAISGVAPLLMPDEVQYQLNDCNAKALVILDALFDAKFAPVADQVSNISLVLVAGATDVFPSTKEYPAGRPLNGKTVLACMDFLDRFSAQPSEVVLNVDDPCYIQYTGGTTGPPKGAVLTHGNLVSNMTVFKHYMQFDYGAGAWVTAFPMFHLAGLFIASCALAFGFNQGVLPDPRNLEAVVQTLDHLKPFFIANVPSLAFMLMADEDFKGLDFSNLKIWLSGAAPFPVDGIIALEKIIGPEKLVEVWGMTETSPLLTVNPAKGKKKIGSVGLPLPNTEFRIVDITDGETEVPLGSEGELIASGPQVMQGYLNKPEESENALRKHAGRIWMHTGDVGRMDEDGFVYIVDRAKDMIVVGGFKVFSSEVEEKLSAHPAIEMCALIGLPNQERPDSEIVKLYVQKSKSYKNESNEKVEADLIAFAKETLAPYKVPKLVEFIEALPLTSVGKLDKKKLRR
jgi:long-chain acyl-CoA synthetase